MRIQRISALICILLPLAALIAGGCGILAFPFEAAKLTAANAKTIAFTADIVDESDQPLDAVTVSITAHALAPDALFVETDETKGQPSRVVDRSLTYSAFGNYVIVVTYAKAGYGIRIVAYAPDDHVQIRTKEGFGFVMPQLVTDRVNTLKEPRSKIVLRKMP